MSRIDSETVQRIIDTADIVEVVSDFVHLKRRGANYIGLCPFHNERTPSFSVSKSKGICKCFSCGKGGSPVNFIMQLEQMNFNEALRYLAKKYNIEITEHELTEEERREQSEREGMFAVNEMAMLHFEQRLLDSEEGRNVGLAYFRQRGIDDRMIQRFHLGYSLDRADDLLSTATSKGFEIPYLEKTGLCYTSSKSNKIVDRFRGRVIYPVHTVSGKVVAFGGRTLRSDKTIAKYVNSPESSIYSKSHELYGLYQARQAIVKKDRCILVEGYMDVISMHQSGIENVVASSGTSLTEGQIRMIHRFTENVTVIYDSDPAGVKASLRGIDLLLKEGLNVKVLSLPDGEDPDSFAQGHSSSEVDAYLDAHQEDFISFKTRILLRDAQADPIERARVIQNIVQSISLIPDPIVRTVYIGEVSRNLLVDEKVLTLEVTKRMAQSAQKEAQDHFRRDNYAGVASNVEPEAKPVTPDADAVQALPHPTTTEVTSGPMSKQMWKYEQELVRYVVKFGAASLCGDHNDAYSQTDATITVLDYILSELEADGITWCDSRAERVISVARDLLSEMWPTARIQESKRLMQQRDINLNEGIRQISQQAQSVSEIQAKEQALSQKIDEEYRQALDEFDCNFIGRQLVSNPDDMIRQIATEFIDSRYHLSKIHTKYSTLPTERERLHETVPQAVYNLKSAIVECQLRDAKQRLTSVTDAAEVTKIMEEVIELSELKKQLAKYLGERILTPKK